MGFAIAQGVLIIVQAELLSRVLAGRTAAPLLPLSLVIVARAGLAWGRGVAGRRAAAGLKESLRVRVLRQRPERPGETITLLGRGLDALDPYVAGYLPQRAVAAVVPVLVVARLAVADWRSALTIAVTLPLIPVFGALIGWRTREATARQWTILRRLGDHFLDVVSGLSTLRSYGRDGAQVGVVARMADGHRRATMATLRIAFLSALALELVGTLSVALVAVPAGLRLLGGSLSRDTALLVLLLAPEAYLPLRMLGAEFHAGAEGRAVLDALPGSPAVSPAAHPDPPGRPGITVRDVTVRYDGRDGPALDNVSLRVEPGEHLALTGPSGAGKTTLLRVVLGLVRPASGTVAVDRTAIGYVPQHPHLFACSVADNIRLGRPGAPLAAVEEAAEAAAVHDVIAALPGGYATVLGEGGHRLSAGQAQRIAIARAYLLDAPIVVLDEPTARLDLAGEAAVLSAATRLLAGRTALLVAHRPALLTLADRVVRMDAGRPARQGEFS